MCLKHDPETLECLDAFLAFSEKKLKMKLLKNVMYYVENALETINVFVCIMGEGIERNVC